MKSHFTTKPQWLVKTSAVVCISVSLSFSPTAGATDRSPQIVQGNLSLKNEIEHAISKGADWLQKNQSPEGSWAPADHPAVTALALVALQGDPASKKSRGETKALQQGYKFLESCVQKDGGIYRKRELLNYNTSVSMLAFVAANRAEYRPILLKARQFVIGLQNDFGAPGEVDSPLDGGIGYGSSRPHADMANTLQALEALYYTQDLARDQSQAGLKDLNWPAVLQFIQNCQNLPSHNAQKWASDDPQNKGGFVYFPGHSMAGETNLPSGRVALRSYGSISYAGLLSYIYADLKRDDPRVRAVLDWLRNNFTLEENPGMGPQGLFYYYHTMAKALTTYGLDEIELTSGRKVRWRDSLALKLINLQKTDGSWINENGRWWEKEPALVTAYALITLELIQQKL
ncbi:MAG: prenyltransferase/squalene oxidase repeat-containing protein [Verrucomicrobiota bacterium]